VNTTIYSPTYEISYKWFFHSCWVLAGFLLGFGGIFDNWNEIIKVVGNFHHPQVHHLKLLDVVF
jgi:hypothetical protein